ncbi:MAG: hypothetical protein FWD15_04280 [Alphaproteobacteria bacterium]|nr:hypothetical protein [Alphaproteobacteria bacterium]
MTYFLMSANFDKNSTVAPVSPFWEHQNLGKEIAEEFYSKFQKRQSERKQVVQTAPAKKQVVKPTSKK